MSLIFEVALLRGTSLLPGGGTSCGAKAELCRVKLEEFYRVS